MFNVKFLPVVVTLLSLALFSCEEEDPLCREPINEVPTDTVKKSVLLTKKQWAPTDYVSYAYDGQQKLSRYESAWLYMAPDVTQTYQLTVDYRQDSLRYIQNSAGEYLEYFYHDGKISEAIFFGQDHQVRGWYVFNLNENNQLEEVWNLVYNEQASDELQITKFSYDNCGNLTSIKVSVAVNGNTQNLQEIHRTEFGDYDNRKNPEPFIMGDIFLPDVKLSVNNPAYKQEIVNGEILRRFEYQYTYNESGYLLRRKETMTSHPQAGSLDVRYYYE